MEYIYPTFERGRIMKKESLWALRDYSYTVLELQYLKFAVLERQELPDYIKYVAQIGLTVAEKRWEEARNATSGDAVPSIENLSFSAPVPYSDPVPISISVPVQYEDYMDETAPDTLEDMQMSEIWSRDSAQKKKGITIPLKDYLEFGVKVGFINSEKAKDIRDVWEQYEAKDYSRAKVKLDYQTYTKEFNGYMVIDRQYYDDVGKYLKFNGTRGQE